MSLRDPIIIPQAPPAGTAIRRFSVNPEPSDEPVGTTYLGTPVYSNLIFNADPDTPENQDLVMDSIIMDVAMYRNIVVTPVSGRSGTVKEYISNGDYEINVSGVIISQYMNVYPKELVTALKNFCELEKAIGVSSNFLNIFNISDVVITRYNIGEKLGSRNEVPFNITMLSDDPIEIKVNA